VIAIDTNILVHAHRGDSPWHAVAAEALARAALATWAIPWPCIHEFLAIATHPKIFNPPSPLSDVTLTVEGWLAVPSLRLLSETDAHWEVLSNVVRTSGTSGPRIHDARIAAICVEHAVHELWTADRDFSRFPMLVTRNPLFAKAP
jgi:toxin-antitoxin system PIN domain toxin